MWRQPICSDFPSNSGYCYVLWWLYKGMAEVNEDSEDDCGVVSNKNPLYLLQCYK